MIVFKVKRLYTNIELRIVEERQYRPAAEKNIMRIDMVNMAIGISILKNIAFDSAFKKAVFISHALPDPTIPIKLRMTS